MKIKSPATSASIVLCGLFLVIASLISAGCRGAARIEAIRGGVEQRITSVLTLHTAEYIYRDVIYFGEQSQFLGFIPAGSREILFSVNIAVRAGVNLQRGFAVETTGPRTLRITLPPAEVLYSDAMEDTIFQYFLRQSGREISFIEVQDVIANAKNDIVEDAVARGILSRADRQAERIIRELLEDYPMDVEIRRTAPRDGGES